MKTTTIKSTLKTLVIAGAIIGSTSLMADAGALYKKCAGCHGQIGEKSALGKSKIIQSMSKDEISTAINGYKDGSYGGAMKGLMKGQVASLSSDDVESLSTYISGLKK